MFQMLGYLMVLLLLAPVASTWQNSDVCQYTPKDDRLYAHCLTKDFSHTVSHLDTDTTHLLLVLKDASYFDDPDDIFPDFSHLKNLEALALDHDQYYSYSKIQLERSSFPEPCKLRIFKSQLLLNFTADAFANLRHLDVLTLSNTASDWNIFPDFMNESLCQMQNLKVLDLTQFTDEYSSSPIQDEFRPNKVFKGCKIPSLLELKLRNCGLTKCYSRFYVPFPNLSVLDISYNKLVKTNFHASKVGFVEAAFLILFNQFHSLDASFQMMRIEEREYFNLESLDLNLIIPRPRIECNRTENLFWLKPWLNPWPLNSDLRNLCLTIEKCVITTLVGSSLFPLTVKHYDYAYNDSGWLPSLQLRYFDFSNNKFIHSMSMDEIEHPHGLDHLEYLDYMNNGISSINPNLFNNMPSLKTLLLGYNNFGVNVSALNVRRNANLTVLDLSFNGISEIPADFFSGDYSLRELNLTGNNISELSIDFKDLINLELLNLSHNAIKSLTPSMQASLDDYNSLTLVLTGNLLSCECSDLSFIDWLLTTHVNIYSMNKLVCQDSSKGAYNLGTLDVEGLKNKCFPDTVRIIILSVVVTFVVTFAFAGSVFAYCKRWRLRYWWHITRKAWQQITSSADTTEYEYDAFVAYDHRDVLWVKDVLLVEMEDKRNFKLCVHHRDFPAGDILEDVIVESIHKSRKTILLLTDEFVKSRWCDFEYRIARRQLFDHGKDIIVAVILKPLPLESVSGGLYQLLKEKLYLKWVDDDEAAKELFWRKLSDALGVNNPNQKLFNGQNERAY